MHIHHQEMTKRINHEVRLAAFVAFLETALEQFGFDDETPFETMLEEGDGHRAEGETRRDQLLALFTADTWPRLHQVVLSNPWIKGTNLKVHWVRRLHGSALTVAWDLDVPTRAEAVAAVLEEALEALADTPDAQNASSAGEELERLFGSMFLAPTVAAAARETFLKGDFRACLTAAHQVLEKRLAVLLGAPLRKMADVEELFRREPPCFLLPELSGPRLQLELTGLARILTGLELLLQPLLRGKEPAPSDPAAILKKLVLISFLVERLETANPNPAAMRGRRAAPRRTPKPTRARKVVKKVAPKKKSTHKGARTKSR